jgi:hypothetical protein
MGYSWNELRQRVFAVADRLALEKGSLAIGIEAVHRETGGGREAVSKGVAAWKSVQKARAADMPNPLRILAVRIAEEAWALANIALARQSETPAGPPRLEAERQTAKDRTPGATKAVRSATPARPAREEAAAAKPRRVPKVAREVWADAHDREFARAVAEALNDAGYPLFARELESCPSPPSKLPGYSVKYPGRAIGAALKGSGMKTLPNHSIWFIEGAPPSRPRKPVYEARETNFARKRLDSPSYVNKAVKYIERSWPDTVHFSQIWKYVNPPEDFEKPWLRHALRDIMLSKEATFGAIGKRTGNYRAKRPPTGKTSKAPAGKTA